MAFWGVVKLISTQDGISQLPPEDDEKVADLANVMFYFFIICIILLGIYLICSVLVIIGAAKVSIAITLYFYNNEPSKNKHFLILLSSLARILNCMREFESAILAIFQFWTNGTFETVHGIQNFFGRKTFEAL